MIYMAEDHLFSLILPTVHLTPLSNTPGSLLSHLWITEQVKMEGTTVRSPDPTSLHLYCTTCPLPENLPGPQQKRGKLQMMRGCHHVLWLYLSIFWRHARAPEKCCKKRAGPALPIPGTLENHLAANDTMQGPGLGTALGNYRCHKHHRGEPAARLHLAPWI